MADVEYLTMNGTYVIDKPQFTSTGYTLKDRRRAEPRHTVEVLTCSHNFSTPNN